LPRLFRLLLYSCISHQTVNGTG